MLKTLNRHCWRHTGDKLDKSARLVSNAPRGDPMRGAASLLMLIELS